MSRPAIDAVLLLAHGGPERLEDVPDFLSHIRGGRPLSQSFVAGAVERYRLIGGSSPLRRITQSVAKKLEDASGLPVYVGMRHWEPFIKDTLSRVVQNGHRRVLCICMAPHYSSLSIGAYQEATLRAKAELSADLQIDFVDSWGNNPLYLTFHMTEIERCLLGQDLSSTQVLLTAHSLPEKILTLGDPYVDQLSETCAQIAERLNLERAPQLTFQSASPSGEPWLAPSLEETLQLLKSKGVKTVVVSPIGFVAEHVEILYDIDVFAQSQAAHLGISLKRTSMLNDSEQMVAILMALIEQSQEERRGFLPSKPVEQLLA
jgi:ferrochelatase